MLQQLPILQQSLSRNPQKNREQPQDSTQTEGYIELSCAATSPIQLNASALSDPHSLFVSLISLLILDQDHLNKILFWALIDSRSTHCFVDSKFTDTHHLKTSATPPVALYLFDSSSNNIISEITNLPIIFFNSDCMNMDFYVTPLDSSCSLVLGYNWLAWYNPLIDWVNGLINFCPSLQENLTPSHIMANIPLASPSFLDISLQSLDSTVSISASETLTSNSEWSNIAIISAAVFLHASKLPGSSNFKLCFYSSDIQANFTKLVEAPDFSNVPSKYHEFTDVFRKTKAEVLTPHVIRREYGQTLVGLGLEQI